MTQKESDKLRFQLCSNDLVPSCLIWANHELGEQEEAEADGSDGKVNWKMAQGKRMQMRM